MSDVKKLSEYKDQFTLDGRLKPQPFVTKRKVEAINELMNGALLGSREAKGRLEEVMTSTDAIFNWAHSLNINFLPQYDALEPTWKQIAGTRSVPDFRPAILWGLVQRWDNTTEAGGDPTTNAAPHGILPKVPEGANYPFAALSGQESKAGGISKRGLKTGFTFEAFINDSVGVIRDLPSELLLLTSDTADYDVYNALIQGVETAGVSALAGGDIPDGETVAPNAPLSRSAIIRALYELSLRKINNRYVRVNGGYNLLVPIGQAGFVKFWLNQAVAAVADGSLKLTVNGYNPLASVEVIETEWVTGDSWYILPQPGATRRPVIDYGLLSGYEQPEVRVDGSQGSGVGGQAIGPFAGGFDNDSVDLRVRQIGGGILWSPELVVSSDGSGEA